MATETSLAFQHLHQLLQELEDAQYMLGHGPKRIAAAEKKLTLAEQASADQRDKIQQMKKKADEASLNLKTREADIQKHQGRLNEAGSNKEYEIITDQINGLKESCAQLEDEILVMLSDVDDAAGQLETLQQEVAAQQGRVKDIQADVAAKEPGLKENIARLEGEVTEAEKIMPPGEGKSAYQRLKASQGASGMSKVEDGYCTECNTAVTPQDAIRLNMGEFCLCRACGRVLYRVDK